ncbi:PLP-dependent aminotransferase family protein [Paenibacillus doosanensis]|uniref:MocR-like pyridoxine biosynthesis transcription factor PdxR n=1 Tax=Paenibacillus doosanensis TaxID=1229154 RepID=UPI0021802286|nr:PLP-dependent aminotransferase family protein [Paenibacillus doosanensis]MCS7458903.1 PLP-dependent aminotransferase family protein [Paenibacillus doosanensis]
MDFQIPYQGYTGKYPTKMQAFYHAIKDSIISGVLPCGTKLPSSRELAALSGVSRGTVNQVYDMLAAEGYVECRVGRGTFVFYDAEQRPGEPKREDRDDYALSPWGGRVMEQEAQLYSAGSVAYNGKAPRTADFHAYATDLQRFPHEEWNRCLHAQARLLYRQEGQANGRGGLPPTEGDQELREQIAQYLRRARGIAARPEQIIVVNGSMQAITLTVQLLVGEGDKVIVESPGFKGIPRAVRTAGGVPVSVPVDGQGIVPADWDSRLLFVTPGRQFPTGVVLSLERRRQLLEWAYAKGAVIVEDDYDSEFRHRGMPLEPLKALDGRERVIHIGSFTKTLLPSVRIGYAVLPPALAAPFAKAKALFEPLPAGLLEQKTLAAFMAGGQYERHLRRMKRIYSRKYESLSRRLADSLSERFSWVKSDAGLHIFGWWRGCTHAYEQFRSQCADAGVRWSEIRGEGSEGVRIGVYFHFPHLTEEEMEYGVAVMKRSAGS